ncbi:MAG: 50S ribosomal protein L18 [Candidatus Aenigmarchaeota archaeon]|nr:50S ribosomal protein L18 [Candidatus Aenigmarchaeota archaeon]
MMFRKLKRRIEKKTDYYQRLRLLKSGKVRLVVRRSLRSMLIQLVEYKPESDKILMTVTAKHLRKFGWKGGNNIASAYLTGLLAGFEALKKGIGEAILDIGLHRITPQSKIFAVVKGCNDAGLYVPIGEDVIPSDERVSGKHIEEYAKKLKDDKERYERQFSQYLKNGLKPEEISSHFEEVKNKIIDTYKDVVKKVKEDGNE